MCTLVGNAMCASSMLSRDINFVRSVLWTSNSLFQLVSLFSVLMEEITTQKQWTKSTIIDGHVHWLHCVSETISDWEQRRRNYFKWTQTNGIKYSVIIDSASNEWSQQPACNLTTNAEKEFFFACLFFYLLQLNEWPINDKVNKKDRFHCLRSW